MSAVASQSPAPAKRAIALETVGMSKIFGPLVALDDVSIKVPAGSFHALLRREWRGQVDPRQMHHGLLPARPGRGAGRTVAPSPPRNPRDARAAGIGMVYQHFTLVPSLTGAENLVIARLDVPAIIDWRKECEALDAFMRTMPFQVPLHVPLSQLAAGGRQKLEILKQLYLDQRFLILDEPTSVLTPGEADEMLGLRARP